MEEYDQYQKIKNKMEILTEKLRLNIISEKLWQYISRFYNKVTDI